MILKTITLLTVLSGSALALNDLCTDYGVFSHPTDCTRFYTCHGSKTHGFKQTVHKCPYGMIFSKTEFQCINYAGNEDAECEYRGLISPMASDPACEDQAVHCNNCTHLVFCQLIGEEFQNPQYEDCATSTSGAAPYCDSTMRTCTSLLPEGCQVPGFVCTSVGFFPDTKSCNIYHICYDTLTYESFRCTSPTDNLYNSQKFKCSNDSICEPPSCGGTIGLVSYPSDPRYYLLCMSAGRSEIYSCPGNTHFIDGAQGCQFVCEQEGLFAVHDDCFSYYRCEGNGGSFNQEIERCPEGMAFNPISGACDALENVRC